MGKKIGYSEPADYFPKSVRKELKIGEYAKKTATKKVAKKTATKKKTVKRGKK